MFFIDTESGEKYDAYSIIFRRYLEKMPVNNLGIDDGPPREPGRTDLAHLQLWVDLWNEDEIKTGRATPRWSVVDSWTPPMFSI